MKPPFDIAADLDTPVSAYLKLKPFKPRFLLESVEGGEFMARYSFVAAGLERSPGSAESVSSCGTARRQRLRLEWNGAPEHVINARALPAQSRQREWCRVAAPHARGS